MAACSAVSALCCGHSLKKPLNPSYPPLHSAIINLNKHSTPPFCSAAACYSSVFHSDSRQRFGSVKPIGTPQRPSRGGLSASLEPGSISTGPSWIPRLEDLDTTNMFLKQRIVFLGSQVDDNSADFVINQLLLLDAEDSTKDIKLFINSPGGSVTAGMGIYDTMKLCKADVSTICFGLAASMGAFLLASGTKGKRFCMPNCKVMVHQPYGGQIGGDSLYDKIIRERELNYHKVKFNKIYSRITGKSIEQIEKDTIGDYYMNAWEAVDYGIADAVIDDGKPGLVAPIGEKKQPPVLLVQIYSTVYDDDDYMKYMPSEEKLIKEKVKAIGESSGGKDASDEKDSKQVEEGAAASV